MKYRIVRDGQFFSAERLESDRWWYVSDTAATNAADSEALLKDKIKNPDARGEVVKEFEI